MLRNKDIKQLQQILLIRRLIAYLLILRYFRMIKKVTDSDGLTVRYEYDGGMEKGTGYF